MTKDPRMFLVHILECAERIEDYIRDGEALIHDYEGVDLHRVWSIATRDLPTAKVAIAAILPPLDQLERELAGDDETPQPRS